MIHHGDNLAILPTFAADSFSSCVCDPPYGLKFMNKHWDVSVPSVELWREVYRVLKPGAHLLAFFGTRTYHRGVVAIEDAGFEIRDMVAWVYGEGFPKSLDIGKAIDKAAGAEREVVGREKNWGASKAADGKTAFGDYAGGWDITAPATEAARQWHGWGTALKPALEPIVVARKPLIGTVAENVLAHGCGGINVDGSRVGMETVTSRKTVLLAYHGQNSRPGHKDHVYSETERLGRWPANLIHDGSEEVVNRFPNADGMKVSVLRRSGVGFHDGASGTESVEGYGDSGSAARFFYCAKPSEKERGAYNNHPTVKPLKLIQYLIRLVTPKGGLVLDPFLGSGTTAVAAALEGMKWVGIEREEDAVAIARRRIFENTML